jgi:hypothetical protein
VRRRRRRTGRAILPRTTEGAPTPSTGAASRETSAAIFDLAAQALAARSGLTAP